MPWAELFWLVIGGWMTWKVICFIRGRPRQGLPKFTQKPPAEEKPAPIEYPKDYDKHLDAVDKVMDEIGEGTYAKCYNRLDKLLDVMLEHDEEHIASGLIDCFEGMCEGKKPAAVLALYDKLNAQGSGIAVLHKHDHGMAMAHCLTWAISDNEPERWTKAAVKKLIDLLEQDHPLVKAAWEHDQSSLLDCLNLAGEGLYEEDWAESDDPLDALSKLKSRIAA